MKKIDLQGHRGARGLMPENTLAAFARAMEIGVHTLELDCAMTRDGVLVTSHDLRLNPDLTRFEDQWLDTLGPAIFSLDYEKLCSYDVGAMRPESGYAERFPAQTAMRDVRIPRLREVFELAERYNASTLRFNIETKIHPLQPHLSPPADAFAGALIAEIRAANLQNRSSIQSFDWRTLAIVQAQAPEIETVYLSVQQSGEDTIGTASKTGSPWTNRIRYLEHGSVPRMVHAAGGRIWSPHHADLNADSLNEAHALGIRVIPWTVNNEAEMRTLIDLGVDGLISDYPNRLRNIAASMDCELPPQYAKPLN
ncbi:MAG TPA: glycerophosphodiester phosphodiesterase [Burkholderiales bacterium]|jgi:glycerophosphoryl diester phosphodiesterase|nr:glycerophosphodiester phosphodiesterase [Burkholderiales bacterium]